jgi:YVTN family beta-propeller protein
MMRNSGNGRIRKDRMNRTIASLIRAVTAAAAVSLCVNGCREQRPANISPLAVAADPAGRTLYIAARTAGMVVVLDAASGGITSEIALPSMPSALALSPGGGVLYVAGGGAAGRVYAVDVTSGSVSGHFPAGHTPSAVAVSGDGSRLYVCNRFDNNVFVIDTKAKRRTAVIEVVREPVAAALADNGDVLFVANALPAGAADGDYISAAVSVVDTSSAKAEAAIELPNGSTGLQGLCASPDGRYVYVTHILGRYHMPTTQLDRGWMNTNALSVIDAERRRLVNTVLLDDVDLGAANPWGVACTADGRYLCVACAGTHEIIAVDRIALHEKLARIASGEKVSEASFSAADVPNDLSFLVGLKKRIRLAGTGPRGIAVAGTTVYAAEYFSDSVGITDIVAERQKPRSISLGAGADETAARRGERLFHDATICFQHWQSCASCHPGGARVDGLNWDLLNDGIGNPKNTKSLLLSHATPPAMVSGVRGTAEAAVRAGIKHIFFTVRPEDDAAAIDEYLKGLEPVPSPRLSGGGLSESARRGKSLFEKAGCGTCHAGKLFTDMEPYDVGTAAGLDAGRAFDTPSLVEVWRTAPYLYDGRAATMEEVLGRFNTSDSHGRTSGLTKTEIRDLCEFVLSL